MKYQIVKTTIFVSLLLVALSGNAQQTDPVLTAAVTTGDILKTNALNNMTESQKKIATWQTSIMANLSVVRKYEEDMYNYLHNVSGAVKNAIEIKQAAELTSDIVKAMSSCATAAASNPKGLAITAIVSKQTSKAATEMVEVYSYIATLTLNKATLLNAVERNQITWNVLYKLRRIKSDILLLQFQIENYTLADIPRILFPMEYFYVVDGKRIASQIIRDFSKL